MDFTKYKQDEPYPDRPVKPIQPHHNAGSAKVREYLAELEKYEVDMARHKDNVIEWNRKEAELFATFKKDLFEDFGIVTNDKREKLFEIAWEYGHAYGYSEVYIYAERLAYLIY